jgi:murein DD-endopeptidase MepM/ murein hydrolase activator NlpD
MRWALPLAAVSAMVALALLLVRTQTPIEDPLWWFTNEAPPRVSIEGPSGPLRGPVQAFVRLEPADRTNVISISVDGRAQNPGARRLELDSSRLGDGQHTVEVVARDTSRRQNQASATWSFVSDNSPPRLEMSIEPSEGPQEGRTLLIRFRLDEPTAQLETTFGDHPVRLQPDGNGGYWALEGVTPGEPSPTFLLRFVAVDQLGNTGVWEEQLPVRRTPFAEDDLDMDPSQIEAQARADENARLDRVYRQPNGQRRWDGPFRLPVTGPITTEFGTHRSYEYHPGTDFAAPMDAPVLAPADGVVAFEAQLPARGNVLVLDHGAGVFSTYAHLQRFDVRVGAQVKAGQTVARVGTTGFSTGPHLHWELWVDGANVDPVEWTHRAFP